MRVLSVNIPADVLFITALRCSFDPHMRQQAPICEDRYLDIWIWAGDLIKQHTLHSYWFKPFTSILFTIWLRFIIYTHTLKHSVALVQNLTSLKVHLVQCNKMYDCGICFITLLSFVFEVWGKMVQYFNRWFFHVFMVPEQLSTPQSYDLQSRLEMRSNSHTSICSVFRSICKIILFLQSPSQYF